MVSVLLTDVSPDEIEGRTARREISRQGLGAVLLGLAIGFGVGLAATQLLSSLVYGVSSTDPGAFAEVSILLALISSMAMALRARRASRVDPMIALHYE